MNRIEMKKKNKVQDIANTTQKIDNNNKKNIFVEILYDYFSTSTLHGVGYFGAKDKNLIEKIWWVLMFILSVAVCSFLISKTWLKWKNNPVILSFEKEQIPIWNIPFPAVTVCPLNKILQFDYNYTEMFRNRHNLSEEDYKLFWDVSLICNLELYDFVENFTSTINITDESAVTMIRKFAPSLNETFGTILWQNQIISETNFAEQMTEEGLCFTFNTFNQEDMYTNQIDKNMKYIQLDLRNEGWTMEDGYSESTKMNTHPRRSAKDGRPSGLSFELYGNKLEFDYVCGMPTSGFKIILHNPIENPKASQQYFLVPLNRKFTMIVSPEFTSTSKSLQDLPPHTRKCYFAKEKYLKFYKMYSQNNCRLECNANITRQFCGCVPFYMPRDKNTAICGFGSSDCVRYVEDAILKLEVLKQVSEVPEDEREDIEYAHVIFKQCACLPSCTSLHYSAETSQTEIHLIKALAATGYLDQVVEADQQESFLEGTITTTQVDIFYKESQFFALHRSELYGQTDFLANCGGLLGLFMGFSLLSLMEIIYFLTIRLWIKCRNRHQI